jgi:hypothetical protein
MGQVADLVEEQRAAPGCLEVAVAVLRGASVRALARTEEFRLEQVFGNRAAIDGDERPVRALAAGVQGARHQLLARARFAVDEHRRHAARHLGDALLHVAHGLGVADEALQRRVLRFCPRAGGRGVAGPGRTRLQHAAHALHRRGHDGAELLQVHRLGQVVERAGAQRLHGVLGRAVGGHDHAALAALLVAQVAQQFHAEAVGQAHVGDHRIEALHLQLLARLAHAGGGLHAVAFAQQRQLVQRAQVGLVVHDEDGGIGGGGGRHQTTIVSNSEAVVSAGRLVPRNVTVKALPGTGPRARCWVMRW